MSSSLMALLSVSAVASAQVRYKITDLGSLGGTTAFTSALGINESGQVVGSARTAANQTRAFVWSNGTMTNLGALTGFTDTSAATGINNAGQIVGYSEGTRRRAVTWQSGAISDLGVAVTNGSSTANGLNESGQIVGGWTSTAGSLINVAGSWSGGTRTALTSPYPSSRNVAVDINESGQIVSTATSPTDVRSVVYSGGTATDIGSMGGETWARGINDSGWVVGSGRTVPLSGDTLAFIWKNGVMTSLGTLSPLAPMSQANDINNSGQVVGTSVSGAGALKAFVWENGQMKQLDNLLHPTSTGWLLSGATGINNVGQIIGRGKFNGVDRAFIATPVPVPEPGTMVALGLGVAAMLRRRKKA